MSEKKCGTCLQCKLEKRLKDKEELKQISKDLDLIHSDIEEEWKKNRECVMLWVVKEGEEERVSEVVIFEKGLSEEECMRRSIKRWVMNEVDEGTGIDISEWDDNCNYDTNIDMMVAKRMKNVTVGEMGEKRRSLMWTVRKSVIYIIGGRREGA